MIKTIGNWYQYADEQANGDYQSSNDLIHF